VHYNYNGTFPYLTFKEDVVVSYNPTEELNNKGRDRRYDTRTHLRRWDSSMWSRTHLECSVSPLSGSITSLRILSRKSANLSGLQRWTSSPITCKQSRGLPASGRGRAIMLIRIRIRLASGCGYQVLHMLESRTFPGLEPDPPK
jgi:hypothetical protein